MPTQDILTRRDTLFGPGFPLFYDKPLHLVRGEGVWLYDQQGQPFLDAYNNVAHVGHCHPHVVAALTRQAAVLNTHTRYLHEGILEYAERLTASFHPILSVARFTCPGTESNELALRIAQTCTGGTGVIVSTCSYHGNSTALAAMSPRLMGVTAMPAHVRAVPTPDLYRASATDTDAELASRYADDIKAAIDSLTADGIKVAALLLDTILSTEGLPNTPAGFMAQAVKHIHDAGGLFIADEVQPGFGRTGTHMWGYPAHDVIPDIVTLGKPMGNGHPVAGLVTRADLLTNFGRSNRYFNTFGGNPVSCAVGMAVLDVLEQEHLLENALDVGEYAREGMRKLAEKHDLIGDVRGCGLFIGAEMVLDRNNKSPATELTAKIVNGMRERGVLLSCIGPANNVLKIRPPMPFSRANADQLLSALDDTLTAL